MLSTTEVKPITMATKISLFLPRIHPVYLTAARSSHTVSLCSLHLPCNFLKNRKRKGSMPFLGVSLNPYSISVDYLDEEFSGHGVTFEGIGDSFVAKMGLENGTTASVMLPGGLVTSYRVPLWHGDKLELLHTLACEGEDKSVVVKGGMSVAISCGDVQRDCTSPNSWALRNVRGSPQDYIQLEMVNTDLEDNIQMRHILTLQEDSLSSELVFSNPKSSVLRISGGIINHLTVSTPDATYGIGLEGSEFYRRSPISSQFSLIPVDFGSKRGSGFSQLWGQYPFLGILSGQKSRNYKIDEQAEGSCANVTGEENENYKQLTEEMSRIYTSAPRTFTIIDRGRRNSVAVESDGFEELYLMSPGSAHEYYGKNAYVCIGQIAMLEPVILSPKAVWKGGQRLHNPNL